MYANELASAPSEAGGRDGGGSGSTTVGTDCSLMVYGAPSEREDSTAAGVDAIGPLGGVWAAQCVRYSHPHDSRPVHSPFTSLHRFGADSASGWASCSIGCIHVHLVVGWVPVDLAEEVVAAEVVAGAGSIWHGDSRHQLQSKRRKKKDQDSPEDHWQVLFHLQTWTGAGQGLACLPLAHWAACGLLDVLDMAMHVTEG
jgi:hypothetical protein